MLDICLKFLLSALASAPTLQKVGWLVSSGHLLVGENQNVAWPAMQGWCRCASHPKCFGYSSVVRIFQWKGNTSKQIRVLLNSRVTYKMWPEHLYINENGSPGLYKIMNKTDTQAILLFVLLLHPSENQLDDQLTSCQVVAQFNTDISYKSSLITFVG